MDDKVSVVRLDPETTELCSVCDRPAVLLLTHWGPKAWQSYSCWRDAGPLLWGMLSRPSCEEGQ